MEPFVIGICGGSASGKTTVANKIIKGTYLRVLVLIYGITQLFPVYL